MPTRYSYFYLKTRLSIEVSRLHIFNRVPKIAYYLLAVLTVFISSPSKFILGWNDGNGAVLGIIPLFIIEEMEGVLRPLMSRKKSIVLLTFIGLFFLFYVLINDRNFSSTLTSWAVASGLNASVAGFSFVQAVLFSSLSFLLLAFMFFDVEKPVLPFLYMSSLTMFLLFDSLLPYDEIGPLQYAVAPTLQFVAMIMNSLGVGNASAYGNLLRLSNSTGVTTLAVYWPSAGVQGIIIALLVTLVFCWKIKVNLRRIALYCVLSVFGSYLVNVARIIILSLYVMQDLSDTQAFERFHSSIGDVIFFPWVIFLIYYIYKRETLKE